MSALTGHVPGFLAPFTTPADEDDFGLLGDIDEPIYAASPDTITGLTVSQCALSRTPYLPPVVDSQHHPSAEAGLSRISRQSSESVSAQSSASSQMPPSRSTPATLSAASTTSKNLHVQVSRLTRQHCALEDLVAAFDERLSKVERIPAMFEDMLDGVVDRIRGAECEGGRDMEGLQEALTDVKTAAAELREEVSQAKDMREAIGQLRSEVEELKQSRQRYGKEREQAENAVAEERSRERELQRAREDLLVAERAKEKREYEELKERVTANDKHYTAMMDALEALRVEYAEKHREMQRTIAAAPALDVEKSLQPLYGKLDALHALFDATRQGSPASGQHGGVHAGITAATVNPMRFLDIPPSENGDEVSNSPLYDPADTAEAEFFSEAGGPSDQDPLDSTQYIDTADYEHEGAGYEYGQAAHGSAQQVRPKSSSEDRVEAEASLEPQAALVEPADTSPGDDEAGVALNGFNAESAETDVGASLEGVEPGETSDSSNARLQTPATEDLCDVEPTERATESIVSEPATEARKRRISPSQSSASEEERQRKRLRRTGHSAAQKTPSKGQSSSQTHVVTFVHVSASRRPKSLKKAPKRKSQGTRKDVVPKWRMHIQALAVSDGTRRGTAEWPPKVEYTVKGRAQEIICEVCKGRAHWFCAGFEDDDPAPEGEWHCPDCTEKLDQGTPRGTIDIAPQTRCIRYNCLLKAKVRTVRKEGDQEEWYPERIIGRQAIGRVKDSDARIFLYLIKWVDWDFVWSTWEPVKNFSTQKYMIDDFMRELHDQGVRTKPRVNLLLEAAKYFDAETAELKPEYADDSDQEEGDESEAQ